MTTKYATALQFHWARAYRALIRLAISGLVRWRDVPRDLDRYTIVLGCHSGLGEMLPGNLACLARQDLSHLAETLLVFDSPGGPRLQKIQREIAGQFPALRCRVLLYSPLQRWVTRGIGWAWVNCWLSWCLGISASRTRWVMLHDFDAMLVDSQFIEKRFRAVRDQPCEFLGIRYYDNPSTGLHPADELVGTIELLLDAGFMTRTFRPIDIFNHVTAFAGRRVEFDTFLWAQSRAGRKQVIPVELDDLVHPSQMICHYAYLLQHDRRLPLDGNSLMLIPYFMSVGGHPELMRTLTEQMAAAAADGRAHDTVSLHGRSLDLAPLRMDHLDWLVKQARHLEVAMFRAVRPEVARYLDALQSFVVAARARRAGPGASLPPAAAGAAPGAMPAAAGRPAG